MGWVWRDDGDDADSPITGEAARYGSSGGSAGPGDRCSTRKVVKSRCRTEEVEPRKFVRKCERTEEILRDCVGRCGLYSPSLRMCVAAVFACCRRSFPVLVFRFGGILFCRPGF